VEAGEVNPKSQIPNPKSQKLQIGICWDLELGIWDLGFGISYWVVVVPPPLIVIFSTVHVEQSPL